MTDAPDTTPATPAAPAYAAPAPVVAENPGKTLGIVALVLSIILSIVGAIVGIVALNKSKKAGHKNGFALAAIIIGFVFFVIQVIAIIASIALAAAAFQAIQEQCQGLEPGQYETTTGITITCN